MFICSGLRSDVGESPRNVLYVYVVCYVICLMICDMYTRLRSDVGRGPMPEFGPMSGGAQCSGQGPIYVIM